MNSSRPNWTREELLTKYSPEQVDAILNNQRLAEEETDRMVQGLRKLALEKAEPRSPAKQRALPASPRP